MDVSWGEEEGRGGGCKSLTPAPAPPSTAAATATAVFWPCDKCFKPVLIMCVTEEEMEASADRQDEWSIYMGGFL